MLVKLTNILLNICVSSKICSILKNLKCKLFILKILQINGIKLIKSGYYFYKTASYIIKVFCIFIRHFIKKQFVRVII